MKQKIMFILAGKMIFEAEDIDDAFVQISKHFKDMAKPGDGIPLAPETDITVKPLNEPSGDYRTLTIKGRK